MHRLTVASLACALVLSLAACSTNEHNDQHQLPAPPAATSAPESSASPSAARTESPAPDGQVPSEAPVTPAPAQTSPEKLDPAVLPLDQLPGWEQDDMGQDYSDTEVEPASCTELHHLTVGKIASDMGAMAAYTKDDLAFQEFLEVVDKGTDSVAHIEQLVAKCPEFTMNDAGENTPVKVSHFDAPGIGEKSFGLRLTMQGEASVDLLVIVAAHKDVLLTTTLEGEKTAEPLARELAQKAMERVTKTV